MATLADFISWRGDLEFWQDGFHVVDNLILSCISYVEMDGVFTEDAPEVMSLQEISARQCKDGVDLSAFREGSVLKDAPLLLQSVAETKRYRNVRVRHYVSKTEADRTLQFAAMEFLLPDGTSYVAFRGTDDSIVGWKEDFLLAISEVEAEKEAVAYVECVAKESARPLRIGGHSKGGHLAVYAGAKCGKQVRERILSIYSNDGPGFMKKLAGSKAMQDIAPKVVRILPEDSIVGMLMEPIGKPIVVKSTANALSQHNLATWCVGTGNLDTVRDVSKVAKFIDKTITKNIAKMTPEEIEGVVENLFSVFSAGGALTLTDLANADWKSVQAISKKAGEIIKTQRKDG